MKEKQHKASYCALVLLTIAILTHPGLAWASGKICAVGMRCQWLFRGAIGTLVLGVVCFVILARSSSRGTRRFAYVIGVINLVMGERFFTQPTYDIFYNNSFLSLAQMGVGVLCLALAIIQSKRAASVGQP